MLLLGESESIELKADAKLRINSEQFSLSVWKILIIGKEAADRKMY